MTAICVLFYQNKKQQQALKLIGQAIMQAHPPKPKQVKSLSWDKSAPRDAPILEEPFDRANQMYQDRNVLGGT